MSIIELQTQIKAPIEVCFDLSRSIELHTISTAHTNEIAVAGKISGLCSIGDSITWRAKHFGIYQQLTVCVVACNFPTYFEDQMVSGAFKSFVHRHHFKVSNDVTLMHDEFTYQVPHGIAGRSFDKIILKRYMEHLLRRRNQTIQYYAESGKWRTMLKSPKAYK